jgi:hypothetical protein
VGVEVLRYDAASWAIYGQADRFDFNLGDDLRVVAPVVFDAAVAADLRGGAAIFALYGHRNHEWPLRHSAVERLPAGEGARVVPNAT